MGAPIRDQGPVQQPQQPIEAGKAKPQGTDAKMSLNPLKILRQVYTKVYDNLQERAQNYRADRGFRTNKDVKVLAAKRFQSEVEKERSRIESFAMKRGSIEAKERAKFEKVDKKTERYLNKIEIKILELQEKRDSLVQKREGITESFVRMTSEMRTTISNLLGGLGTDATRGIQKDLVTRTNNAMNEYVAKVKKEQVKIQDKIRDLDDQIKALSEEKKGRLTKYEEQMQKIDKRYDTTAIVEKSAEAEQAWEDLVIFNSNDLPGVIKSINESKSALVRYARCEQFLEHFNTLEDFGEKVKFVESLHTAIINENQQSDPKKVGVNDIKDLQEELGTAISNKQSINDEDYALLQSIMNSPAFSDSVKDACKEQMKKVLLGYMVYRGMNEKAYTSPPWDKTIVEDFANRVGSFKEMVKGSYDSTMWNNLDSPDERTELKQTFFKDTEESDMKELRAKALLECNYQQGMIWSTLIGFKGGQPDTGAINSL